MLTSYKVPRNINKTTKCYPLPDVSQVVVDADTQQRYFRGRLLGKGGFARCYEVTDMKTNQAFACKVVAKARISKPHQRQKIINEIEIHRSLDHVHVVGFNGYFEDEKNVYILLELCSRKSLVQLLKQRKCLLEPEIRYFMHQAIMACSYLHSQSIIHRDIKLGNFFLNHDMELKLGDFGLACRVGTSNHDEMTVCGTPNYIAPEVLKKGRHGFEVDTWALGCVMYTLFVGRPPFETMSLKETYSRIKRNQYDIPSRICKTAAKLIEKFLSRNPENRPNLKTVCQTHEFFIKGFMPSSLPTSCCVAPPRFTALQRSFRNSEKKIIITPTPPEKVDCVLTKLNLNDDTPSRNCPSRWHEKDYIENLNTNPSPDHVNHVIVPDELFRKLSECLSCMPKTMDSSPSVDSSTMSSESEKNGNFSVIDRSSDILHKLYVCKWVDYSNKYGFGAELSDGSVLVRFNDATKMTLTRDKPLVRYCDKDKHTFSFPPNSAPERLSRKIMLLEYFATYMEKHLLKGSRPDKSQTTFDDESPFLAFWIRTPKAMVICLTNGTVQVNFFEDHTKIILNPGRQEVLVTFINEKREHSDYMLANILQYGCPQNIRTRLDYCKIMLKKLSGITSDEEVT